MASFSPGCSLPIRLPGSVADGSPGWTHATHTKTPVYSGSPTCVTGAQAIWPSCIDFSRCISKELTGGRAARAWSGANVGCWLHRPSLYLLCHNNQPIKGRFKETDRMPGIKSSQEHIILLCLTITAKTCRLFFATEMRFFYFSGGWKVQSQAASTVLLPRVLVLTIEGHMLTVSWTNEGKLSGMSPWKDMGSLAQSPTLSSQLNFIYLLGNPISKYSDGRDWGDNS